MTVCRLHRKVIIFSEGNPVYRTRGVDQYNQGVILYSGSLRFPSLTGTSNNNRPCSCPQRLTAPWRPAKDGQCSAAFTFNSNRYLPDMALSLLASRHLRSEAYMANRRVCPPRKMWMHTGITKILRATDKLRLYASPPGLNESAYPLMLYQHLRQTLLSTQHRIAFVLIIPYTPAELMGIMFIDDPFLNQALSHKTDSMFAEITVYIYLLGATASQECNKLFEFLFIGIAVNRHVSQRKAHGLQS